MGKDLLYCVGAVKLITSLIKCLKRGWFLFLDDTKKPRIWVYALSAKSNSLIARWVWTTSTNRAGLRGAHLPITARTRSCSTQERFLLCSCREILEHIAGTSSLVILSAYLQKTAGPSMVQNLSCSTYVNSVPLNAHFSPYCNPRPFMFPLLTCVCGYCWPSWSILPLVIKMK